MESVKAGYKALVFLDHDKGRDVEILMPLLYYAEKVLHCRLEFAFVWDMYAIYRKQPDVVILPNTVGSIWYFYISRYAHQQGIKVFALISEGNFRTDGTFDYWGYNLDKKFYQDYICHWSKRTCDFLKAELSQFQDQMVLTGATGFDRFSIYKFISRDQFFKKYGLKTYKKVIGYAGWAFGKLFDHRMIGELYHLHENKPEKIEYLKAQMRNVENVLLNLIEANPDTLFILKRHPNELHPHITKQEINEMISLRSYPNVIYLVHEESIQDLINISDLWLGYETTTALEAWLMNKVTILINPDPNFIRDKLYLGSVVVKSYPEISGLVEEFYRTGSLAEFQMEEKKANREKLIRDTIGFKDGLNHIRAGLYLEKTLQKIDRSKRKRIFSFKFWKFYTLMNVGKYFYIKDVFIRLPKFKKTVWIFERYKLENLPAVKDKYFEYLDDYYSKQNLRSKIEDNHFRDALLDGNYR